MKIIYDFPPNYAAIAKAFKIEGDSSVVFTYGETLYVPGGTKVSLDKPLMKHEETHVRQQRAMGVEAWWERFLIDPEFRFEQELEAYREQYRSMAALPLGMRVAYLTHISKALAGEIYGNLMTWPEALEAITQGITFRHISNNATPNLRKLKKQKRQNKRRGRL